MNSDANKEDINLLMNFILRPKRKVEREEATLQTQTIINVRNILVCLSVCLSRRNNFDKKRYEWN